MTAHLSQNYQNGWTKAVFGFIWKKSFDMVLFNSKN
jgi:hypothetical protein